MHLKKKVVVVDDNEVNAEMLEEFLTQQGYSVALAFSAQDGLKLVTDTNPDLVILDLFLPDMKGSQVCVQLRARKATQNIPIILCTSHSISQSEKMMGFRSGVDDYLIRPFELSELAARMEALLRRSTPYVQSEVLAGIDALLKIPHETTIVPIMKIPEPVVERPVEQKITIAPFPKTPVREPALDLEAFQPLHRAMTVLNHPKAVFQNARPHEDILVSLMLVLATPMVASLAQQENIGSTAWLSSFGIKTAANLAAWFALSGITQLAVPFLGQRWSLKRSLSLMGLSWAPRALEAVLTLFYAFLAPLFVAKAGSFSSGIDLVPGFTSLRSNPLIAEINIFSLWSVALVLIAIWTVCGTKRKWNSITVGIAGVALLCGMLAHV